MSNDTKLAIATISGIALGLSVGWQIFPKTKIRVVEKEVIKEVPYVTERSKIFQACTDQGGIPVTSVWDGRLKDCIFKDEN